jgi:hypothetical protein
MISSLAADLLSVHPVAGRLSLDQLVKQARTFIWLR